MVGRQQTGRITLALLCLGVVGCQCTPPETDAERLSRAERLASLIEKQSPTIPADEAELMARTAVEAAAHLHTQYKVTCAPWLHNAQYHLKTKPRGLCYHWADDLFWTLCTQSVKHCSLYLVVANDGWPNEHHGLVICGQDQPATQGVLLDGWRGGGVLFFCPVAEDPKYTWKPEGGPWLLDADPMGDPVGESEGPCMNKP